MAIATHTMAPISSIRGVAVRHQHGADCECGRHKQDWCDECCNSHRVERRLGVLARFENPTPRVIFDAMGDEAEHLWPADKDRGRGRESRMLNRDLAILRASRNRGQK